MMVPIYTYWISNQVSADPAVYVGPVELFTTTMPCKNRLPMVPNDAEKLAVAPTVTTITGTEALVSSANVGRSNTRMN